MSFKKLLFFTLCCLSYASVHSQPPARIQFVNNCPEVQMPMIDVWVNGSLFIDNLEFRNASAFMNISSAIPLNIGIAPQNSNFESDTFYSTFMVLQPQDTVIAIATGTENATGYNPHRPFRLDIIQQAREKAYNSAGTVDYMFVNGVTDAPIWDIRSGVTTLADDITYGYRSNYYSSDVSSINAVRFRITNPSGSKRVDTYSFPSTATGWADKAALVIGSGFVNPSINNNGTAFEMMAVLSSGGQFIPLITTTPEAYARIQMINNSADSAADSIDLYINNDLGAHNLGFRTATSFVDAPVKVPLQIGAAPKNSTSVSDVFAMSTMILDSGKTYIAVANGIKSATGYSPMRTFAIKGFANAREAAATNATTDILFLNGATDGQTFDVKKGTVSVMDDISYNNFSAGYVSSPIADDSITLTDAAGTKDLFRYRLPLQTSSYDDQAITIVTSGFVSSASNSNGPKFGLYVATANGGPLVPLEEMQIPSSVNDVTSNKNSVTILPNPANNVLYLGGINLDRAKVSITDLSGKSLLQFGEIDNNRLNIESLPTGVYLINIASDKLNEHQKFIKQ